MRSSEKFVIFLLPSAHPKKNFVLAYLHCLSIQEDSIELLSIHLATYAIDLSLSEAKELAGVGLRARLKLWELVIDIENDVEGCCDTAGVVCRLCLVMEDENSESAIWDIVIEC